jgi:hypothetical protein
VTTSQPKGHILLMIATRRADAGVLEWLQRALPAEGPPEAGSLDHPTFLGRYAGVTRRLGAGAANSGSGGAWSEAELKELQALAVLEPRVWSVADVARCGLILIALDALPSDQHVAFATEIFRRGETAERVGLLRSLALLPDPPRFVELAAEACRSHVQDVLEALFCENPFACNYMPELAFNQLIMKAMFVGIPLARVRGWESRVNAELIRMARDFKAERRAAARPVPAEVALIEDIATRGQVT